MKVDGTEISLKRQATFFLRGKKTKEKENNLFFNELTTKGQQCTVVLPKFETVQKDGIDRLGAAGLGYIAFGAIGGLIGYAASSGTKSSKKTINTRIGLFENGIQINNAIKGKHLRIKWNNIINVTYQKPNFIIKTDEDININFSFGTSNYNMETMRNIGNADKLVEMILNYCNKRSCGVTKNGWSNNETNNTSNNFCSNCGNQLNMNDNFCKSCGKKLK